MVSILKNGLSTIFEGVISRMIIYGALRNRTCECCFILETNGLPCTNSDIVVKRLKENDIVVTQPSNIFSGDFDFIKSYFSELEKQPGQLLHLLV